MAEESVGPSAASASTTPKLFVRQSSGLVRNVSVTNALFFNVAAFVGVGLTLYPIFYTLAVRPGVEGRAVLRLRLGGDHRRPLLRPARVHLRVADLGHAPLGRRLRVHEPHPAPVPRLAGVVDARHRLACSIIAFEVPLVLRNLQITARIIGIGAGGLLQGANTWFTDSTGRSPAPRASSPRSSCCC